MKTLALLLLLSIIPSGLMAQDKPEKKKEEKQEKPMPDRWRGLVIDESTPEDVIAKFGKPAKDELARFPRGAMGDLFSAKTKEKKFQRLDYKELEGIDKAYFTFNENKLVAIALDIKKEFSPNALSNTYGLEFKPAFDSLSMAFHPEKIERNQGKDYAIKYPTVYNLVAKSEKTFIVAMVANNSFGSILKDATIGGRDKEGSFPGKVAYVEILSRTLENRD